MLDPVQLVSGFFLSIFESYNHALLWIGIYSSILVSGPCCSYLFAEREHARYQNVFWSAILLWRTFSFSSDAKSDNSKETITATVPSDGSQLEDVNDNEDLADNFK